jgi:hypothetical protein
LSFLDAFQTKFCINLDDNGGDDDDNNNNNNNKIKSEIVIIVRINMLTQQLKI